MLTPEEGDLGKTDGKEGERWIDSAQALELPLAGALGWSQAGCCILGKMTSNKKVPPLWALLPTPERAQGMQGTAVHPRSHLLPRNGACGTARRAPRGLGLVLRELCSASAQQKGWGRTSASKLSVTKPTAAVPCLSHHLSLFLQPRF